MNRKELAQFLQSGASGSNPYAEGEQQRKLHEYLMANEPATAGRKQAAQNEANLQSMNDPRLQDLVHEGGSAKVGDITLGGNPYARILAQGPHQAQAFLKTAGDAYKGVNDQLDSSRSTLENLNLGNSTGDKMALINEARLMAGQGGSRALSTIIPLLSGDPSMGTDLQKGLNWLQNTPNIPTLQPAQRDAIREAIYARLPEIATKHTQLSQRLLQQGAIAAPQADSAGLVKSFSQPADQNLQALQKMQAEYQKQRLGMAPQPPVSAPAQANANPTTLDKLKTFFTRAPSPSPQGVPSPAQPPAKTGGLSPEEASELDQLRKEMGK